MRDLAWFRNKKWGVSGGGLFESLNERTNVHSLNKWSSWDDCLNDFDCDLFASTLHDLGAGYTLWPIMQLTRWMAAPSDVYNEITGYKPGEACPTFDFIERLYQALAKYDIDLFLYFTGDGPAKDPKACAAFGGIGHNCWVTDEFVEKWSSVARDISMRYGKKLKGWWLDGCYDFIGYNDERLQILHDACRAGNPDALVATNFYGCLDRRARIFYNMEDQPAPKDDDYTAGEMVVMGDLPPKDPEKYKDCCWHIYSPLSVDSSYIIHTGWNDPGTRYTGEFLENYVKEINRRGGVITIGICSYRDGSFDPEQLKVLSYLKNI